MVMVAMFAAVLVSCNQNDNEEIEDDRGGSGSSGSKITQLDITIENGRNYSKTVSTVNCLIYSDIQNGSQYKGFDEWVDYNNGSFSFTLPESIPEEFLELRYNDHFYGGKASNQNFKCARVAVRSRMEGSKIWHGIRYYKLIDKSKKMSVWSTLVYFDRDVTITGTGYATDPGRQKFTTEYDVNAKKGWNWLFTVDLDRTINEAGIEIIHDKVTTTNPGGMKWYYDEDISKLLR